MNNQFNSERIEKMIKLTMAEHFMLARSPNKDEILRKIFQARLNFKAFFNNSNIAEDIEAITDIIKSDPYPEGPLTDDTPDLQPVITIDGIEIKMNEPIESLDEDEVISRLKICNNHIK